MDGKVFLKFTERHHHYRTKIKSSESQNLFTDINFLAKTAILVHRTLEEHTLESQSWNLTFPLLQLLFTEITHSLFHHYPYHLRHCITWSTISLDTVSIEALYHLMHYITSGTVSLEAIITLTLYPLRQSITSGTISLEAIYHLRHTLELLLCWICRLYNTLCQRYRLQYRLNSNTHGNLFLPSVRVRHHSRRYVFMRKT